MNFTATGTTSSSLDEVDKSISITVLKYVAYCSSLKKADIIDIYQKYLDRWDKGANAAKNVCDFLDVDDLDDTVLNAGNEQRLMLVAANFRKEVTSTALWLIGHGIRAQCFRVVPYGFGQELLIDLQQIIPTPEAADYMIGMAAKESEEKSVQGTQKHRHELRRAFWTKTLEALRARGVSRYKNISPSKDHWLPSATGMAGCGYNLIFSKNEARVELYLQRSQATENKWIFDQLEREKQKIEDRFDAELQWQRLDDKKASRVCYAHPFDGFSDENWPEMIEWLCKHIVKLEGAFSEPLSRLNRQLKSKNDVSTNEQSDSRPILHG